MLITGLVKIDKLKEEDENVRGTVKFIADETKSVEIIGFLIKKGKNTMKMLEKFKNDSELLELTGKLFKENKKAFYIKVLDLKLGKTKYNLFNEEENLGMNPGDN